MRVQVSRLAILGLAAGSLLFQAATANAAMDPKKVADAIVAAALATDQTKVTYAKAATVGADIVISTLKMVGPTGDAVEVPSLVISGAADRTPGGFTATKITFDKGKATSKDPKKNPNVTWNTGSLEGATLPSVEEIKAKARITPLSKLSFAGINVTGAGLASPIDVASVNLALADVKEGVPHQMKMNIDGINLPAAVFSDPSIKASLTQVGYTTGFLGAVAVEGTYVSETDTMTLSSLSISADKVGKVTFATTVSGIPLSKLADSDKSSELVATAMVNAASIRFDNAGVVERVLDMQAKSMGTDRKGLVAGLGGLIPLGLTQSGFSQAFASKFTPAANIFLADPRSFVIISAPATPVPVLQVLGAAFSTPGKLPDVLTLDVKANQ